MKNPGNITAAGRNYKTITYEKTITDAKLRNSEVFRNTPERLCMKNASQERERVLFYIHTPVSLAAAGHFVDWHLKLIKLY